MPILGYNIQQPSITFQSKGAWFPKEQHNLGVDDIPDPILCCETNGCIWFYSHTPCTVTVDWGDGIKESHAFAKVQGEDDYEIIFASLNCAWQKNPNNHPYWFYQEDGSEYEPVKPHVYADGQDIDRAVTFTFTTDIYGVKSFRLRLMDFPILDLPLLENLQISSMSYDGDDFSLSMDKINRTINLKTFNIGDSNKTLSSGSFAPLMQMPLLEGITCDAAFDLRDIEANDLRSISRLRNLKYLRISSCGLPSYIKEFNDLPSLTTLHIAGCSSRITSTFDGENTPDMSEVQAINPSVRYFNFLTYHNDSFKPTGWKEQISGKGLENLYEFYAVYANRSDMSNLPEYLKEMRNISSLKMSQAFLSQTRIDTFVQSFYNFVIGWQDVTMSNEAVDGKRNQFYALEVYTYAASNNQSSMFRPSGTLQAPAGFEQGVSNGTPSTPMECIYVLTNNYKQVWTIKPETVTSSPLSKSSINSLSYSMTRVDNHIFIGTGEMISPEPIYQFSFLQEAKEIALGLGWDIHEVEEEYNKLIQEGGEG